MSNDRITIWREPVDLLSFLITYQPDEHTCQGIWSKPNVPLLIFSDHMLAGTTLSHHGGPVGGCACPTPLQLIFWGAWWTSPAGSQRRSEIVTATKNLLNSVYFTELAQYGVAYGPSWRGAIIVTKPGPPGPQSMRDASRSVVDLVDDLIDDEVFPDPDDGPRIAFIVLMPDGFSVTDPFDGAHRWDYDYDFPFDEDRFWAGWVTSGPVDATMTTLSHELAEMLTDPELDAWHTEVGGAANEISDAGFSTIGGGTIKQSAFVNGTQVQSYWSNRHGATVIPIDRDYAARLVAKVKETSRRVIDSGTFRPPPSDSAACSTEMPECCMEDRNYRWATYAIDEIARVRLVTERFSSPGTLWTINGVSVWGAGSLSLTLPVEGYKGRDPVTVNKLVTVHYLVRSDLSGIDITASGAEGNFDLLVACTVTESSIIGNLATNFAAHPQLVAGFVGAAMLVEDAYIEQRSKCLGAMLRKYMVKYKPTGKPRFGDPIDQDNTLFARVLPVHVRPGEYRDIRRAAKGARAARALLPAAKAEEYVGSLVRELPAINRRTIGAGRELLTGAPWRPSPEPLPRRPDGPRAQVSLRTLLAYLLGRLLGLLRRL